MDSPPEDRGEYFLSDGIYSNFVWTTLMDQLYVFVKSDKDILEESEYNHGKVILVFNLKNNDIANWKTYH